MTTCFTSTFSTPAGPFSLAVNAAGAVTAAAFGPVSRLRLTVPTRANRPRTAAAQTEVEAYFAGKLQRFTVSVEPSGTAFQQQVWAALRAIPFGQTRSYGQLAAAVGSAPRAVGRANATNPVCLLIPCHRVIGADGSLTGYAFGPVRKGQLLALEAQAQRPARPGA